MSGFTSIFGSSGSAKSDPAATSGLSTSTLGSNSNEVKKQIQQQIAQELAVANATELVNVRLFINFWYCLVQLSVS